MTLIAVSQTSLQGCELELFFLQGAISICYRNISRLSKITTQGNFFHGLELLAHDHLGLLVRACGGTAHHGLSMWWIKPLTVYPGRGQRGRSQVSQFPSRELPQLSKDLSQGLASKRFYQLGHTGDQAFIDGSSGTLNIRTITNQFP